MFQIIAAAAARLGPLLSRAGSRATSYGAKGATQAASKGAQRGAFGKFAHSTVGNTILWTVGTSAALEGASKLFGGGSPSGQKPPSSQPHPSGSFSAFA